MTAELPSPTDVVQAAGGLVVRRQSGILEIVVVHRPVHDDWSFPKGKLEAGETFESAALREVREETGMSCRLLRFIGHTEYVDRKGRPKAVAYWVMAAEAGFFTPNAEVDELRWLSLENAARLLSYPRDGELATVLMAADQVEPAHLNASQNFPEIPCLPVSGSGIMGSAIYRLIALPACVPQSKAPGPIAKGPVTALCRESTGAPSAFPLSGEMPRSLALLPSAAPFSGADLGRPRAGHPGRSAQAGACALVRRFGALRRRRTAAPLTRSSRRSRSAASARSMG